MMEDQYSKEIMDEAARWIIKHTYESAYYTRDNDIYESSSKSETMWETHPNMFVIEDGKLVGFKVYGVEGILKIPFGKIVTTDSGSSHDWMYNVYETETTELKRKIDYAIRELKPEEVKVLDTFLYEAIFIPEGVEAPPFDIIKQPELQVYVEAFGEREGDICFVAEADDRIIGAVWVRIMNDYGHVDDDTPSFAVSLLKEYRGGGVGTKLMERMLTELRNRGFKKASLAVQKKNYAVRMYKQVGFEVVNENEEEFIMICRL